MKKSYCAFLLFFVSIVISGCVSSTPKVQSASTQEKTKLFQEHMDRGGLLEKENNFKTALEEYKLAMTIDPESPVTKKKIKEVEKILQETAELHYQKGLELDKQGKYEMARKEYLAALQNWPDHAMAKKILTAGQVKEEKAYIVHIIRSGDSISKLAIIYYGNYKKYPQIGKFNAMKNATQVEVGQKVMVPEIEGVTLADLEKRQTEYLASLEDSTTMAPVPRTVLPSSKPETMEVPKVEPRETAPVTTDMVENTANEISKKNSENELSGTTVMEKNQDLPTTAPLDKTVIAKDLPSEALAMAVPEPETIPESSEETFDDVQIYLKQGMDLFDVKEYDQAIVEFDLAKKAEPDNPKVLDYLFQTHFQKGLVQHLKGEFLEATKSFEMARENNPSCENCAEYMAKSLDAYKEKHYTMGIHYFGKEELKEAIAEWELVKAVDAGYKDIVPNLKKAEMLSHRLETIKKSED